jgi:transglutaminase-like putative cysteine protease
MTVSLEPITPPVVLLPENAQVLRLLTRSEAGSSNSSSLVRGPEDELRYTNIDDHGLRYDVFETPTEDRRYRVLSPMHRSRYLTLPVGLPERVGQLALQWTRAGASDRDKAIAVERRLREEYKYDLSSPSGASQNPLDHFLFESKRGHCEFYSTAMAMLLRTVGVPTRNVTGFIGGTYNRFGEFYAVRQGDAHSWVEVYLDGQGWTRFDPTPPSDAAPRADVDGALAYVRDLLEAAAQRWNRQVVGYDLDQQVQLLRSVTHKYAPFRLSAESLRTASRSPSTWVILLLLCSGLGYWFWRRRPKALVGPRAESERAQAERRAAELYRLLEGALASQGLSRPSSTPPLAHARGLLEIRHPIADEVHAFTELYLEARFGGRILSDTECNDYRERAKALRRSATALKAA